MRQQWWVPVVLIVAAEVALGADRAQDLAKQAGKFKPVTCSAGITDSQSCHAAFAQGCSDSKKPRFDAYLNFLKNQVPATTLDPVKMLSEADFTSLNESVPGGLTRGNHADHALALASLGEGNVHGMVGYLYYMDVTSGKETSNCKVTGGENTDYHIGIGFDQTVADQIRSATTEERHQMKPELQRSSIVVEMTPHYRADQRPGWTRAVLRSIVGHQVKVIGQLTIDNEHYEGSDDCSHPDADEESCWRASSWELHPVTQFYVCGTTSVCSASSKDWKDIEGLAPNFLTDVVRTPRGTFDAAVVRVTDNQATVSLRPVDSPNAVSLTVPAEVKPEVKGLRQNDLVTARTSQSGTKAQVDAVVPKTADVPASGRWLVFGVSAFAVLVIAWLLLTGRLLQIILGQDNRYSKSKFQVAAWFLTVITVYVATLLMRGFYTGWQVVGGVTIPQNLLILSGLSALTFVGAKQITQNKQRQAAVLGAPGKPPAATPQFPQDLVNDDHGKPDLGDFQVVLLTLIATLTYLATVFSWWGHLPLAAVALPDVDTTILAVLGLGQGAYLIKKQLEF